MVVSGTKAGEEEADIVGAAAFKGGLEEGFSGFGEASVGEEFVDAVFGDDAMEAVGAEEEDVARGEGDFGDVGFGGGDAADDLVEAVAKGALGEGVGFEAASAVLEHGDGVVVGEGHEFALAQEVGAAVADMGDVEVVAGQCGEEEGGAHAVAGVAFGFLADQDAGVFDALSEHAANGEAAATGVVLAGFADLFFQGDGAGFDFGDGHLSGEVAFSCAASAVGNGEEGDVLHFQQKVFVNIPDAAPVAEGDNLFYFHQGLLVGSYPITVFLEVLKSTPA